MFDEAKGGPLHRPDNLGLTESQSCQSTERTALYGKFHASSPQTKSAA